MSRCDCIALLYDNDKDHLDFIRDHIDKMPDLKPKVLIQTKMDLIQQQSEQITFQDDFAKELGGLKMYKQISVRDNKYQEAIDSIMMACMDPSKGLTDQSLEIAKSQNDSSIFEDYLGVSASQFAVGLGVVVASVGWLGYRISKSRMK